MIYAIIVGYIAIGMRLINASKCRLTYIFCIYYIYKPILVKF